MASGKTSTGRFLAKLLKRRFVDIDHEIERSAGQSIPDIFSQQGEEFFRKLEKRQITKAMKMHYAVIAVGGGAVMDPVNVRRLRTNALVVGLSVKPATVLKRVKDRSSRPLLAGKNPKQKVQKLLTERKKFYAKAAHYVTPTDGLTPLEVARHVWKIIENEQ